jgi:ParB family transcriptional regulator, chromosome partitioning protein
MNVKDRPRLGRGLKSLISHPVGVMSPSMPDAGGQTATTVTAPLPVSGDRFLEVDVSLIDPNPHQPRATMDPMALQELAASIRSSGILQPVILKPVDGRYQLVAGHRRTEAARLAGLTTVPALLRHDSTDAQQAEWALIENIQRQDLNAIERAKAYRSYVDTFQLTHAQAAERLGEDRATISNFLRLLDLNAGVQDLVARGLLSAGHAKVLAGITDTSRQDVLANRVVGEGLSVRKLEEIIAAPPADVTAQEQATAVSGHTRTITAKSPHVVELEQELSRKLGTKLRIFPSKKKNTGKIVIQYYSLDEFDRIVEKFQ